MKILSNFFIMQNQVPQIFIRLGREINLNDFFQAVNRSILQSFGQLLFAVSTKIDWFKTFAFQSNFERARSRNKEKKAELQITSYDIF